jgi:hypothetical protein
MKRFILSILFLFSTICFAANEVRFYNTASQTRYCRIVQTTTLYLWDTTTSTFVASPTWANSAIDLTENTVIKGCYYVTFPSSTAGYYDIIIYSGTKGTAANTDAVVGGFEFSWSGTAEVTLYTLTQNINVNVVKWVGKDVADATDTGFIPVVDPNGEGLATWVQGYTAAVMSENNWLILNCSGANLCTRTQAIKDVIDDIFIYTSIIYDFLPSNGWLVSDSNATGTRLSYLDSPVSEAGGGATPAELAAAILADPNNKLYTDPNGFVTLGWNGLNYLKAAKGDGLINIYQMDGLVEFMKGLGLIPR